jgi:phosphatidylglycerol:prolipoprotein diacylglycerol transferase
MLAIALAVGLGLAVLRAKKEKINPDLIFNLSFIVFITGIIGARIFYVMENLNYYLENPKEIIMLPRGGLSWFGGLILGIVFGIVYLKKRNVSVYKVFDLIAPFVALSQAIGRIGCLLNGCCFGKVSESGIYFPVHNAVLIPTQIYSSLALIFIFVFLRFLQDRPHRVGQIFFIYLLLYSLKRFIMEFWRADNPVIFGGLTLFHFLSIALFFFACWSIFSSVLKNR